MRSSSRSLTNLLNATPSQSSENGTTGNESLTAPLIDLGVRKSTDDQTDEQDVVFDPLESVGKTANVAPPPRPSSSASSNLSLLQQVFERDDSQMLIYTDTPPPQTQTKAPVAPVQSPSLIQTTVQKIKQQWETFEWFERLCKL